MKTTCDFCKTEYTIDSTSNGPVKCVVCGRVWVPRRPVSTNYFIKFFAAICALVAACIFSFVVMLYFYNNPRKQPPLVASIDQQSVHIIRDENGNNKIFVSGNITNNSDEMYGVPKLAIVSYDSDNNVLSRQNFMPPSTFIEAKTTVTFNHVLSVDPTGVKRIEIELKESK